MKYRKKPVVIEAVQWDGENTAEVAALLQIDDYDPERETRAADRTSTDDAMLFVIREEPRSLVMRTVHGEQAIARVGDWVIPEPVPGRGYPCKPDIFDSSYELFADVPAGIRVVVPDAGAPLDYPSADGWLITGNDYLQVTGPDGSGGREEIATFRPYAWERVEDRKFDTPGEPS